MIDKYDLLHLGVRCIGVEWNGGSENVFHLVYCGREYRYVQEEALSFVADTDYIRCAIGCFLRQLQTNKPKKFSE